MIYDAIIAGAGAAGLTAAAYLSLFGHRVLLCEKEKVTGGLVNSFERNGFTFDSGIRGLEDAGVLFTMLRQLGLDIEFSKNHVSLGIENQIISADNKNSIDAYSALLTDLYPQSRNEIQAIIKDLRLITKYMEIQYGIDNPLFLDPKKDGEYFIKKVFPWMFKYALNVRKIQAKSKPVIAYLQDFTSKQALLDIISQHFFTNTPAYFALSYFKIFQEYYYPKGGTGTFTKKLTDFFEQHGGEIRTNTLITEVDLENRTLSTAGGEVLQFRELLWAADQKKLYEIIKPASTEQAEWLEGYNQRKALIKDMVGGDSVFTVFLSVDLDKSYFEKISAPHLFYTPSPEGQSAAGEKPIEGTKAEIQAWLKKFVQLTTYEISIPVLRDASLAPPGKTGLIVSFLFDYKITDIIQKQGWYAEFREEAARNVIDTLNSSIYPGLSEAIIDSITATPLTMQQVAGTSEGAITGWSFSSNPMPAENRLVRIANAVNTPLPHVTQAGQWTYSPAGFPVSLITGKLAADKINKILRK